MDDFEKILDEVDAAVFSGDSLCFEKNRKMLREYIESWTREIESWEELDG